MAPLKGFNELQHLARRGTRLALLSRELARPQAFRSRVAGVVSARPLGCNSSASTLRLVVQEVVDAAPNVAGRRRVTRDRESVLNRVQLRP
jgi:hypothetical protein